METNFLLTCCSSYSLFILKAVGLQYRTVIWYSSYFSLLERHKTLVSHNTSLLFPLIIFEPDSNQYSYHCMSFKYVSWIRMYISLIAGIQCSWAIYKSTFPTSSYYYNYENDMHFLWTLDSGQTCAWNRRMQDCSHCLQCILFIHISLLLNLSLLFPFPLPPIRTSKLLHYLRYHL